MVVLFLWQHLHVIRRAEVCGGAQSLKQAIVVMLLCPRFFRHTCPLFRPPVFQPEYLSRHVGWNDDLFLCILDAFFFKPLFSIHHDLFQFDGLFYGHGAGLAALEQLILNNIVRNFSAFF